MGRTWLARLLLLASVLAIPGGLRGTANAAPAWLDWQTLETPHFRIHFHEGHHQYEVAQKVARICEEAHALLVPLVGWQPERRTEVVLTDDVDSANGSASATLRPVMRLFADAPDNRSVLNDYEDYLWTLVVHEYAHILHLDQVTGLPAVLNRIFGKIFVPNNSSPRWLTEGFATYEESNLSAGGRIRSSLFDMWLRASIIEGRAFRLDETSNLPTAWPGGSVAYLYGGRFMRYVAERVGPERLTPFFARYGGRIVPYALNSTVQELWDTDWVALYDEWLGSLSQHYAAQLAPVRKAGVTHARVLTRSGEQTDTPRLSSDGSRVFYSEGGRDRRYAIRSVRLDGTDDRLEVPLWQNVTFDLSRDDRFLVFAASEVYRESYLTEELFLVDRSTGARRRLSHGLRGTDPAFSPSGAQVAFIGRSGAGATYVGELSVSSGQTRVLYAAPVGERVFTPAYTPDGGSIVFTQQVGRYQQLRKLQVVSGEVTNLAPSESMVLEPFVAQDGSVYFSSDRTGIYNLYRLRAAGGPPEQLTNFETGAFRPQVTRDGQTLAFTHYSSFGYDIAVLPLDATFQGRLEQADARPAPIYQDDPRALYEVHPYRASQTLLPQYWAPLIVSDPLGTVVGVQTEGSDIIGRHSYRLQASHGLVSGEPGAAITYANNVLNPPVGVSLSTGIAQAAGFPRGQYDRRWTATLSSGMTFTRRAHELSTSISAAYEWRKYDPQFQQQFQPDGRLPLQPLEGTTGTVSVGVGVTTARATGNAISAERGGALNVTVRRSGPETLGTFSFVSVEARARAYLLMPWLRHHTLAFQGSAGVGRGGLGNRRLFSLGGLTVQEPLLQLLEGRGAGSDYLRGYPPGLLAGDSFALGTAEYRFPLADLNRGLGSLPFFLRRTHAALFTDVGAVGDDAFRLQRLRPSVGLELRLELVLGYTGGALLRAGFAQGLAQGGQPSLYVTLGSSF